MDELTFAFLKFKKVEQKFCWAKIGPYPCSGEWFRLRINGREYASGKAVQTMICHTDSELKIQFGFEDGILVSARFSYDPETGIISRRDSISNQGKADCRLEEYAANFPFECGSYEAYVQSGQWCNENIGAWESLRCGTQELNHICGRTTENCTPFTVIRGKYASKAVAFHLIPCGDWRIRLNSVIRYGSLPSLQVQCGYPTLCKNLGAGTEWDSPEVCLQLHPDRTEFSGSGDWQQWVLKHSCKPLRTLPLVYNSWLDWYSSFTPERLRMQLAAAKKAHCEIFIIDYGWFEDHHYFLRIGDWQEKQEGGLNGKLNEFINDVHAAGMKLGLWVEAEFFHASSPVIQEHPDWFAPCNETTYRLRLEKPEAAAYFKNTLEDVIRKYHPVYIKNDMNHSQETDDSGCGLQEYALASRRLFGEIQQAHPEIIWEGCSSGAMRSSPDMLKTYDSLFVSDNADSEDNLRIVQGAMLRLPPGKIFSWLVIAGESGATSCKKMCANTTRLLVPHYATWDSYCSQELNFAVLAAMNGGVFGISGDLASLSEEEFSLLEKYMLFQKQYRDSMQRCSGWCLTPPEDRTQFATWVANQYFDAVEKRHYIYAFHNSRFGETSCSFPLHAIDPDKSYLVKPVFPAGNEAKSFIVRGKQLADDFEVTFDYNQLEMWRAQMWIIEENI